MTSFTAATEVSCYLTKQQQQPRTQHKKKKTTCSFARLPLPFPPPHQPRSSLLSFTTSSIPGLVERERGTGGRSGSSLASTSSVRHFIGSVIRTEGLRFAIVVARFNEVVTKLLLEGALETFKRYSVREEDIDVVWVPGSFEIPVVAERLGKMRTYQAVLCIGAVIRGDTTHYDAVANSAASGVLSAGLNSGVPCIFGVRTCDNMDQALNRAGGKAGNKGAEAALIAVRRLEMKGPNVVTNPLSFCTCFFVEGGNISSNALS